MAPTIAEMPRHLLAIFMAAESARHAAFALKDAPMTGGGSGANLTYALGVPTLAPSAGALGAKLRVMHSPKAGDWKQGTVGDLRQKPFSVT